MRALLQRVSSAIGAEADIELSSARTVMLMGPHATTYLPTGCICVAVVRARPVHTQKNDLTINLSPRVEKMADVL